MKKVVNAIILNNAKKRVLIIKRKGGIHSDKWAFPGGRVEKNETSKQALIREIKEELNLDVKKIIRKISKYEYSSESQEKFFGESYLVSLKDFKIKINPKEISKFKWATLEELEKLDCVPGIQEESMKVFYDTKFKRKHYQDAWKRVESTK